MKIFLSYASEDRAAADSIRHALHADGHDVFFDREDLPAGEEFHTRIRRAIERSDLFVFLVSPRALDAGSYTLNELAIAQKTWAAPSGCVLPVVLDRVDISSLPPLLRSVTFLEVAGNVPAAVADAVYRLARARRRKRLLALAPAAAALLVCALGGYLYVANRDIPATRVGQDGAPAVLIPAGGFVMGDDEASPRRELHVDAFYMDRFETTTARYAEFLSRLGREPDWEELSLDKYAEFPVVGVDWHDADAYCRSVGRRLPTEAEWEKGARGADERTYPWGNASPTLDHANYQNAAPGPYEGGLTPVGTHSSGKSPFAVEDMAGNASEWVADWYSESFVSADRYNPRGPDDGVQKVIRGGGRYDPDYRITATGRAYASPDTRSEDIGFRCASDP